MSQESSDSQLLSVSLFLLQKITSFFFKSVWDSSLRFSFGERVLSSVLLFLVLNS